MNERDPGWLEQLDDYVDLFREDFRRRDQIRWASVYLQGLLREASGAASDQARQGALEPRPAKTIGAIARQVLLPPDLMVEDVAQALQNFVNQSPWDEQKLWRRHRQIQQARQADVEGTFVLEDLALVKQGRHSVGVQRQYSGVLGRKTNCQIALALHHVARSAQTDKETRRQGDKETGDEISAVSLAPCLPVSLSSGFSVCPLGLRLYLPRTWLQSPDRLDSVGVPDEFRGTQTRGSIALELLDSVRGEGWPARRVLCSAGLGTDLTFRQELRRRGLDYVIDTAGLDLSREPEEAIVSLPGGSPDQPLTPQVLTNLSANALDDLADRLGDERKQVQKCRRIVLQELGLDHFEGRSWRGLHHHACLVALAYGFRQLLPECLNHAPSSAI